MSEIYESNFKKSINLIPVIKYLIFYFFDILAPILIHNRITIVLFSTVHTR